MFAALLSMSVMTCMACGRADAAAGGEPEKEPGPTQPDLLKNITVAIPFRCNAYVTPVEAGSRRAPSFADRIIVNDSRRSDDAAMDGHDCWKKSYYRQEPHRISFYFYTSHTGVLHLGLRALQSGAGKSKLKVACNGRSRTVEVGGGTLADYYAGEYEVGRAGYVRVDIEPDGTTAECYPFIDALLAGGRAVGNLTAKRAGELVFVTAAECDRQLPHFTRRGPSNHFIWDMPDDTEYFYNEVLVPEGEDIPGAYYMLTGGDGFYMGIQPNTKGRDRMVLFSVWDTDTAKGDVARLVKSGAGVKSNSYSHEGSGIQNFYYYDWETGHTYATLVRVRPEVDDSGNRTGNSLYTGYFRDTDGRWAFLAEILRPNIATYYRGAYSFSENFRPEYGWVPRSVMFPSQWMRDKSGVWHEVLSARFSHDATAADGLRRDCEGGVNGQGYFYLRNIGYIDEAVAYGTRFIRKPSGQNPPDVDLDALERLARQ